MCLPRKWQKVGIVFRTLPSGPGARNKLNTDYSRGLPLGYLNQLEQRLSETEAALYGALATLQTIKPTSIVQASPKVDTHKTKSMRMEEWSKLPLQAWPDMGQWMSTVSDQFAVSSVPANMLHGSQESSDEITTEGPNRTYGSTDTGAQEPRPAPAWHQDEVTAQKSQGGFIRPQIGGPSGSYSRDAVTRNSDGVASLQGGVNLETMNDGAKSQAEELSKEKCNIYF